MSLLQAKAAAILRPHASFVAAALLLGSWLLVGCTGELGAEPDAQSDLASADQGDQTQACEAAHLRVELGQTTTGVDGQSAPLDFKLPDCGRSFVITISGDAAFHYTLAELTPVGRLSLVPKAWLQVSASPMACLTPCPNRIVAQPAQASFLFPNTPLADVLPGTYRLRAYAFKRKQTPAGEHKPVATQVQIHVDMVLGPKHAKTLALPANICLTGAEGITAATAPTNPRIVAALAVFKKLLAPAAIVAEPIRYFDVAATHRFINSIDGPQSDLAKLFRSGQGLPLGLNVFLVHQIDISAGGPPGTNVIPGISGGLPGPPRQVGCERCGVAAALVESPGHTDILGSLMAHEVAHYLGLYHSTEMPDDEGTSIHDSLPDTPKDASDNLMYWAVTEENAKLTPQQREVLRDSPWLTVVAP